MSTPSTFAEGTLRLAGDLLRERALRARQLGSKNAILDGAELFDYACGITLAGIRANHPQASEAECRAILSRRLEIHQQLQERGLYVPLETSE